MELPKITAVERVDRDLKTLDGADFLNADLVELNLKLNKLESFRGVPQGLRVLNMASNRISSLSDLPSMPVLRKFDASFNQIELISSFKCPNLQILNVSHNKIRIIENLENCRSLEVLDLSFNEIMKIKRMPVNSKVQPKITQIRELYLQNNQLNHMSTTIFAELPNLSKLDISFNRLSSITFLDACSSLEVWHLLKTRIWISQGIKLLA